MGPATWRCDSSTRVGEMTDKEMGFNAIIAVSRFQS